MAEVLKLPVTSGALVIELTPRGPADKAGLRGGNKRAQIGNNIVTVGGDVIVSVNGRKVEDADSAIREVRRLRPGDKVELGIVHWDGSKGTVRVTLGEKPREARARQP